MADEEKVSEIEAKILEVLNKSLFGMSITEIAEKTEINRMTAAKYLHGLDAKNLIFNKKVGTSKLWLPRELLDQRMKLIIDYFKLYNAAVNEILGDNASNQIRMIGSKIGENIFQDVPQALKTQKFSELVKICANAMERVYPIPSLIDVKNVTETDAEVVIPDCLCGGKQEDKSICELQIGIILGIARPIFPTIQVEEKECLCNGDAHCSYFVQYEPG